MGGLRSSYRDMAVELSGRSLTGLGSRGVRCYPMGNDHVFHEKSDGKSFSDHMVGKRDDKKVSATTWLRKKMMKKVESNHMIRKRGDRKS
jgi:hypothetical protein